MSHLEKGDTVVLMTLHTCMLSSVKRMFHKSQPTYDGLRKTYEGII